MVHLSKMLKKNLKYRNQLTSTIIHAERGLYTDQLKLHKHDFKKT